MVTSQGGGTGPFILLVDDDDCCLGLLRTIVESAGHRCVAARSAADAQAYSAARRPVAVVTDLSMPGLDGRGLGRWMKARYPGVPLVLVTGEDLDASARSRLAPTFVAILSKPVDPEHLLGLLGRLLDPVRTVNCTLGEGLLP